MEYIPFDIRKLNRDNNIHSKQLHRSLTVPSIVNTYGQAVQFAREWFLSKFAPDTFKSIYTEGRYVLEDQRSLSATEGIIKDKPALAIVPNIDLSFNNDNIDMYQFGTDLYAPQGLFKSSFFKDNNNGSYLSMSMETLMLNFTYKLRLETRAQQIDFYKYMQLAFRVGNTIGEEVDLDFHIPYELIIQMAHDLGFEVEYQENKDYPKIKNIQKFISYLNSHSSLPFLYKYRAINGKNEFFLRMQRMYVHIRTGDLSNDEGERDGHLMTNFGIEMGIEVRFPAPKFYAYYDVNEPRLKFIASAFRQPQGMATCFYTFKGVPVPDVNKRGWSMYLETTYEADQDNINKPITIDFSGLLSEGELGEAIEFTIKQGISPAIFMDMIIVNGGEVLFGNMDWATMHFTSNHPIKSQGTYIGIYLDKEYINQYVILDKHANKNRIQKTEHPNSREAQGRN